MQLTPATWADMDPETWRTAAADLRAMSALDDTRNYALLAADLNYKWPTKVTNMRTAARRLRAAAAAGDRAAADRIRRAEALAALIAGGTGRTPTAEDAR